MKQSTNKLFVFFRTFAFIALCTFLFIQSSPKSIGTLNDKKLILSDTSSDYYLELKGIVRQSKGNIDAQRKAVDSALITLYVNDIPYSEIWTNKKGKCIFKLALDKVYKVEVSKKGFVTKFFEVNTKVPAKKRDAFIFNFDIDIFEEVKGLNVSVLQKPIAKVAYAALEEQFAYDTRYTGSINFELKKMYKDYYLFQKIEADSLDKTEPNR